ncbi:MAG: flavin reductase [Bacilli bacterium]
MTDNINITEELAKGCLLTTGSIDDFNTMTIGWGTIGRLWGRRVFIVFVRPTRLTYQYMEKQKYFTVSIYDKKYTREIGYFGTKSGRNIDKVAGTDFHPIKIGEGVTYTEALKTYYCKKIYNQDMNNTITDEVANHYYNNDSLHKLYIGEILEEK